MAGEQKHISAGWIPSLDGIRAVSIMIVFVAHAGLPVFINGSTGVTIFFFLSGYLITTLLRIEQERYGRISVRDFYLRRALRIFPPMYIALALAVVATASGMVGGAVTGGGVLAQTLHSTNYWIILEGRNGLPHGTLAFWSLAVEEHFYLLFPALLILLYRWIPGRYHRVALLLGICAMILAWRLYLVTVQGASYDRVYLATDTRVDSILMGSVMALLLNPHLDKVRGSQRLWSCIILPVSVALFWVAQRPTAEAWALTFGYTVQALLLAFIFTAVVAFPESWAGKLLNARPVVFVGVLSYSVYLLHESVLGMLDHDGLSAFANAPIAVVLVLGAAWAMQRWVERPCAKLRRKFAHAGEGVEKRRADLLTST